MRPSDKYVEEKPYNIVVLGAGGVGKTSIISRLMSNQFTTTYTPTVDDCHIVTLPIDGVKREVKIIDTSGTYCFPAMRDLYVSKADLILLVYSLDDIDTFASVECSYNNEMEKEGNGRVPIIIIGNKMDLTTERQQVCHSIVDCMVSLDWEAMYLETSAKDNLNVSDILDKVATTKSKSKLVTKRPKNVLHSLQKAMAKFLK